MLLGDPVPHFAAASSINPRFNFDTVAGRYVVISFLGSSTKPTTQQFLSAINARGERFDVTNAIFFGVTSDPDDVDRLTHEHPGRLFFYDVDGEISRRFSVDTKAGRTFVLDQALRVIATLTLTEHVDSHVDRIFRVLDSMPPLAALSFVAPVLIVPYVFEPSLCKALIDFYESTGGEDSGFMRDVNGKTVGLTDHSHKCRMDCELTDATLIRAAQERLSRRVVPAIRQAYQFNVTRIERNIIACYDAAQGAHFRAHRDNTTLGTAHRRFAVTINLNSPDYEGGEIWFPEFGPQRFKAPSGAAIIFSCSLLHEVPRVTRGKRYAFLPFLYDDAAAVVREQNRKHLGDVSGAGGARAADCNAVPGKPAAPLRGLPLIDGTCGCGNPSGCGTCLSAATYPLEPNAAPRTNGT